MKLYEIRIKAIGEKVGGRIYCTDGEFREAGWVASRHIVRASREDAEKIIAEIRPEIRKRMNLPLRHRRLMRQGEMEMVEVA